MDIGLDLQRAYDDGYKKGWEEAEAYALHCGDETPITNADSIRSMTDEELAEWLERIRLCCTTDLCGRSCPLVEICYSNAEAPKETLDWLRQEAEEGET